MAENEGDRSLSLVEANHAYAVKRAIKMIRRRKVELRTRPHFIYIWIVPAHFLIRFIAQEYFRNAPWLLEESQECHFLSVPADLGSMRKQGIVLRIVVLCMDRFRKAMITGTMGEEGSAKAESVLLS